MKQIWNRAVAAAAAFVCAGAAHAYVIDFESVDTSGAPFAPLLSDGDDVFQGRYDLLAFDGNNAGPPNGSLVGQLVNGADPASCLDGACPAGNSTRYLAALNNGAFSLVGPGSLRLGSFEAAFLPPASVALPSGVVAYLGVEADRADGTFALGIFGLRGPGATGATSFASYAASSASIAAGSGTLTSGNVTELLFYAFYCGNSGSCTSFSGDKGQFAIDNIAIDVPAVPEPAQWILMALGLGAVGRTVRRRRAA